jgi:hypothetical protein
MLLNQLQPKVESSNVIEGALTQAPSREVQWWLRQTIPSKQLWWLGDLRGLLEKLQRRRTTDGLTDCRRWRTSLLFTAFTAFAVAFAPRVPLASLPCPTSQL